MPIGYKEKHKTESLGEDETPIHYYLVELSDRDVDALDHLKGRNGAGIGNIPVENIAVWKMINQVCESSENSIWTKPPSREHPEWLI